MVTNGRRFKSNIIFFFEKPMDNDIYKTTFFIFDHSISQSIEKGSNNLIFNFILFFFK